MPLWSRLADLVKRRKSTQTDTDPLGEMRWSPASDSPFGFAFVDCRGFSQTMLSATNDPKVVESYTVLRDSSGEQYRGQVPEDAKRCECNLEYPHQGETHDGPIFKAEVMEDKWDIYLFDGYLYFARSWTGTLEYRATITFSEDGARVTAVEARNALAGEEPFYPVAAVDYLIRSHLYRLAVPHPLPKSVGKDPRKLALFSFSQYGRYGLFGTFEDTTGLPVATKEQASGPDV